MAKKNEKIQDVSKKIGSSKIYPAAEAVALAKETDITKLDATVEVAYRLNVDPKKADQQIRGAVVLPNGADKTQTALVSVKGDKAKEAEAAGAGFVSDDDMVQKIQNGRFDSDVVVAAPDMMATVGRLGRVLRPKGLMLNPKTGTVTMDVIKAASEVKASKATYRTDEAGNIHVPIGKVSFDDEKLVENFAVIHDVSLEAKPSAAKGQYMKNVTTTATPGPSIHVD